MVCVRCSTVGYDSEVCGRCSTVGYDSEVYGLLTEVFCEVRWYVKCEVTHFLFSG